MLAVLGLQCGLILGVATVIATKRSLTMMWTAIALAIAVGFAFFMLIGRSREKWTYTLETDGQTWIRRWSGTSDVLIRAHEVDRIERRVSEIEVHSRNGTSLTVTPDATGYADLRALLVKWDSDRAIAQSQSPRPS